MTWWRRSASSSTRIAGFDANAARVVVEAGGEEHFHEVLGQPAGERPVDRAVADDDASVGRDGVGGECASYASSIVLPSATPHGFLCFTITQAGTVNSSESARAADRSARLLNDRASPCSCSTRERTWRRAPASA